MMSNTRLRPLPVKSSDNILEGRGSHGPLVKSWPFIAFGRMYHIIACLGSQKATFASASIVCGDKM